MKPDVAFGIVLKRLRTHANFSQELLALKSDLDRTFISMLERGQRQPSLATILALSASLAIPPEEIIKQTMEVLNENSAS